ncbi:hypothetical protein [uncultured Winogradskyella sp.]|uniref:hypothetical protein n=1 Tax=uncultured Winogradskyella sp. TaxID=395353 RepID=UPI002625528C|nr:hypothetical protein [uncultured Winogradskyella sp.]
MGGGKPADTVITLTVDTEGLMADPNNVNNYVVLTDNQSDPAENPGHPETYVSTVNKGATCEWQGVPKQGTDKIDITGVFKKASGGNDILKTPIPPGLADPQKGGRKVLKAKVNGKYLPGNEEYTVNFTINDGPVIYPVDPRIKMNN